MTEETIMLLCAAALFAAAGVARRWRAARAAGRLPHYSEAP